jgi:hypothetical protein
MLRIRVELHHAVTRKVTTIGVAEITNDGTTGSTEIGNYNYRLYLEDGKLWKSGRVEDFPRLCLNAFDLLFRALKDAIGVRNGD